MLTTYMTVIWLDAKTAKKDILTMQRLLWPNVSLSDYVNKKTVSSSVAQTVDTFTAISNESSTVLMMTLQAADMAAVADRIMGSCVGEAAVQVSDITKGREKKSTIYAAYRDKHGKVKGKEYKIPTNAIIESQAGGLPPKMNIAGLSKNGVALSVAALDAAASLVVQPENGALIHKDLRDTINTVVNLNLAKIQMSDGFVAAVNKAAAISDASQAAMTQNQGQPQANGMNISDKEAVTMYAGQMKDRVGKMMGKQVAVGGVIAAGEVAVLAGGVGAAGTAVATGVGAAAASVVAGTGTALTALGGAGVAAGAGLSSAAAGTAAAGIVSSMAGTGLAATAAGMCASAAGSVALAGASAASSAALVAGTGTAITAGSAGAGVAVTSALTAVGAAIPFAGWIALGVTAAAIGMYMAVKPDILPTTVQSAIAAVGISIASGKANMYASPIYELGYMGGPNWENDLMSAVLGQQGYMDIQEQTKNGGCAIVVRTKGEEAWKDKFSMWFMLNPNNMMLECASGEKVPLGIVRSNQEFADFLRLRVPELKDSVYNPLIKKLASQF